MKKLKPGIYTNKRGETIELIQKPNIDLLVNKNDDHDFYTDTGTCMFWSESRDCFFMNTDHRTDLVLPDTREVCQCCKRPL